MKSAGNLFLSAIVVSLILVSCGKSSSNITTGTMTSNLSAFSGTNCIAEAYGNTVIIYGGSFKGTDTKNSFPIVMIELFNYQSTAPMTYNIDSANNAIIYETTTDTSYAYQGYVTISNITPNITGTFSVSMTDHYHKDTTVASGTFKTSGL